MPKLIQTFLYLVAVMNVIYLSYYVCSLKQLWLKIDLCHSKYISFAYWMIQLYKYKSIALYRCKYICRHNKLFCIYSIWPTLDKMLGKNNKSLLHCPTLQNFWNRCAVHLHLFVILCHLWSFIVLVLYCFSLTRPLNLNKVLLFCLIYFIPKNLIH